MDPNDAFIEMAIKTLHNVRNFHKELFKSEPDKYRPQIPDPALAKYVLQLKGEASAPTPSAMVDDTPAEVEASEPTPKPDRARKLSDSDSEIILMHPMMGGKEAYVPDEVEEDKSRQVAETLSFTAYMHGFRGGTIEKQDAPTVISAEAQQLLKWGLGKNSGDPAMLEDAFAKYKADGPLIHSMLMAPAAQQRAMLDAESRADDPDRFHKPIAFVPPSTASSSSTAGPLEMQAMMSPPATGGQRADGTVPKGILIKEPHKRESVKRKFHFASDVKRSDDDHHDSKGVKPDTDTAAIEQGLQDQGVMCFKSLYDKKEEKDPDQKVPAKARPTGATGSSPNQYQPEGRTKFGGNRWVLAPKRRERSRTPDHGRVIDDNKFAAAEPLRLTEKVSPGSDSRQMYVAGSVVLKERGEASEPTHTDHGLRILIPPELFSVSKSMATVLRHKAKEFGVEMDSDGYVRSDVLADAINKHRHRLWTYFDVYSYMIQQVIDNPPRGKKRYTHKHQDGELYVKAVQGHSADLDIDFESGMTILTLELAQQKKLQYIIHGTRLDLVKDIEQHGLICGGLGRHTNKRVHIHFVMCAPTLGREWAGVRNGSDVAVYVDMCHAIQQGHVFYLSINDVVLTRGIDGRVPRTFIVKIVHLVTNRVLWERGDWTRAGSDLLGTLAVR